MNIDGFCSILSVFHDRNHESSPPLVATVLDTLRDLQENSEPRNTAVKNSLFGTIYS